MAYHFYSIRASPMQLRCESFCMVRLFAHFCHRFAPQDPTSLPKKSFSFAAKGCIMLLNYAAFCFFAEFFRDLSAKFAIAIYPRKGTKTVCSAMGLPQQAHCNLSPQGDENFCTLSFHSPVSPIAIYPRKGTKTLETFGWRHLQPLQFIPARGRKPLPLPYVSTPSDCNLSPQGDENRSPFVRISIVKIAIYPRKGTKTSCQCDTACTSR